jgi:hypothetical protein
MAAPPTTAATPARTAAAVILAAPALLELVVPVVAGALPPPPPPLVLLILPVVEALSFSSPEAIVTVCNSVVQFSTVSVTVVTIDPDSVRVPTQMASLLSRLHEAVASLLSVKSLKLRLVYIRYRRGLYTRRW